MGGFGWFGGARPDLDEDEDVEFEAIVDVKGVIL